MTLIPGDMRHTIKVISITSTRDDYGAEVQSESILYQLRASVKEVSGNKELNLNEKFLSKTVIFTTYFRNFDASCGIEFKGSRYNIINKSEIGFREGLLITAELINE